MCPTVFLKYAKVMTAYYALYHTIENTANQNTGKPLYYTNIPIMRRAYVALILLDTVFSIAWYYIVMQCSLVV